MEDTMTCAEFREYTSAWFDGEATDASFEELVGHVHHCVHCRSFMSRLPRQAAMLREIPGAGTAFASLKPDHKQEREQTSFAFFNFNGPMAIAAAIVLVILTIAIEQNLPVDRQAQFIERPTMNLGIQGKGPQ
jgi:predicted anti-sigma-YlaC factor YlaD